MAAFYGQVKGNRGKASRTGSKASGIQSSVQSDKGSVQVWLYERDGEVRCGLSVSDESSFYGTTIYNGTIDELRARLASA